MILYEGNPNDVNCDILVVVINKCYSNALSGSAAEFTIRRVTSDMSLRSEFRCHTYDTGRISRVSALRHLYVLPR